MSRISTYLTILALVAPACLQAQSARKAVITPRQATERADYTPLMRQTQHVRETNMLQAKPTAGTYTPTLSPNGKTAAVSPIQLGTSSNAFTALRCEQNQVVCEDALDVVGFIHRQDINIWGGGGTENGKYRYDISTDGGQSFTLDIGALQTTYTNYGRYPNISLYNPAGNTNPFNAKMPWCGPTNHFPTPGWIGHVFGLADVSTSSVTSTEHYLFDNNQTLLTSGLCEGMPGEFWAADFEFDGTNYGDTLYVYRGVWNSSTSDLDWTVHGRLLPGYDMSYDGAAHAVGPNVAFSPNGQYGWVGILSNVGSDPNDSTYTPVFFKSTDGGATWSNAMEVDLNAIAWIADSLQTLWVDSSGNPASNGDATTGFDYDITVDNWGNVHMGVVIGTAGSGQGFSIASGITKFLADVYTPDQGATWDASYISPVLTFRGTFGTGAQPITMDNFVQVSRDEAGDLIFFSYVDSDTAQFTGNMNGVGFGISDNTAPNLRIAVKRPLDDARSYPKLVTDGDLVWEGRALIPTMAPTVHKVGQRYELPIVMLELLQNDPELTTGFWYFGNDAFYDFGAGDTWCDLSGMNLQWSYWAYDNANPGCFAVGQDNPIGVSEVVLHQSFPNPTAGNAVIRFDLPATMDVNMDLVNMYGQQVAVLAAGEFKSGTHDVTVETSKLAAGVYFYNLTANGQVISHKMVVTK